MFNPAKQIQQAVKPMSQRSPDTKLGFGTMTVGQIPKAQPTAQPTEQPDWFKKRKYEPGFVPDRIAGDPLSQTHWDNAQRKRERIYKDAAEDDAYSKQMMAKAAERTPNYAFGKQTDEEIARRQTPEFKAEQKEKQRRNDEYQTKLIEGTTYKGRTTQGNIDNWEHNRRDANVKLARAKRDAQINGYSTASIPMLEAQARMYNRNDMEFRASGGAVKSMKKDGKINLKDCKVNTAETRNPKHKSW